MVEIDCQGEWLLLSQQRAILWPRRRTAIIADLHLGKGGVFRRAGLAVPAGASQHDLQRLSTLVTAHKLERLLVLGDFFHGAPRVDEPALQALHAFRSRHRALQLIAIRGNHDRHAKDFDLQEAVHWCSEGWLDEPFVFCHQPSTDPRGYVLCGHLHPVVKLRGPGMDWLRLPVFWFRGNHGVLPAFGSFTGGLQVRPHPSDVLYIAGPDAVMPLGTGYNSKIIK